MPVVREVLALLGEHVDQRLPTGLYVAVSVQTERERQRLRRASRPFLAPDAPAPPLADVDLTAAWAVRQASLAAATLGGIAGVGGPMSVPPEALASAVGVLRLAQRLAVIYGFDPETDRGQMAVWRALAAGLEIELPPSGPMQVRLRDVPDMLVPRQNLQSAGVALTRSVLRSTAWSIAGKLSRFVPVLAPGFSAVGSRHRMRQVGGRMQAALHRLAEVPQELAFVEEAIEVLVVR
jgi:hypothetical protein